MVVNSTVLDRLHCRYTGGVFSGYWKGIPAMASEGIPLLQDLLQHRVERREEEVRADIQHRRQRHIFPVEIPWNANPVTTAWTTTPG